MSSRDDILTEGDETVGDELREEVARVRLGSRASQVHILNVTYANIISTYISYLVDRLSVVK